jgi:hypothetical protein
MEMKKRKSRFLIWLFFKIKPKAPCEKENKKRLVAGLHPLVMIAGMVAGKQVFSIHADNPDRTPCRPISIKSQSSIEKKRTACSIKIRME